MAIILPTREINICDKEIREEMMVLEKFISKDDTRDLNAFSFRLAVLKGLCERYEEHRQLDEWQTFWKLKNRKSDQKYVESVRDLLSKASEIDDETGFDLLFCTVSRMNLIWYSGGRYHTLGSKPYYWEKVVKHLGGRGFSEDIIYAIATGNTRLVRFLLESGVSPGGVFSKRYRKIDLSLTEDDWLSIQCRSFKVDSALTAAYFSGSIEMIKLLEDNGEVLKWSYELEQAIAHCNCAQIEEIAEHFPGFAAKLGGQAIAEQCNANLLKYIPSQRLRMVLDDIYEFLTDCVHNWRSKSINPFDMCESKRLDFYKSLLDIEKSFAVRLCLVFELFNRKVSIEEYVSLLASSGIEPSDDFAAALFGEFDLEETRSSCLLEDTVTEEYEDCTEWLNERVFLNKLPIDLNNRYISRHQVDWLCFRGDMSILLRFISPKSLKPRLDLINEAILKTESLDIIRYAVRKRLIGSGNLDAVMSFVSTLSNSDIIHSTIRDELSAGEE